MEHVVTQTDHVLFHSGGQTTISGISPYNGIIICWSLRHSVITLYNQLPQAFPWIASARSHTAKQISCEAPATHQFCIVHNAAHSQLQTSYVNSDKSIRTGQFHTTNQIRNTWKSCKQQVIYGQHENTEKTRANCGKTKTKLVVVCRYRQAHRWPDFLDKRLCLRP